MPDLLIRPYPITTFAYDDPLATTPLSGCTVHHRDWLFRTTVLISRYILSLQCSKARFLLLVETLKARCHCSHNHGIILFTKIFYMHCAT